MIDLSVLALVASHGVFPHPIEAHLFLDRSSPGTARPSPRAHSARSPWPPSRCNSPSHKPSLAPARPCVAPRASPQAALLPTRPGPLDHAPTPRASSSRLLACSWRTSAIAEIRSSPTSHQHRPQAWPSPPSALMPFSRIRCSTDATIDRTCCSEEEGRGSGCYSKKEGESEGRGRRKEKKGFLGVFAHRRRKKSNKGKLFIFGGLQDTRKRYSLKDYGLQ